jgi:F-type H+-transporting ATPase subunit a
MSTLSKNLDLTLTEVVISSPSLSSSTAVLSPLEQFEIRDLLNLDAPILGNLHLSITNIGFYLMVGAFFIFVLHVLSTNYNKLVSNR